LATYYEHTNLKEKHSTVFLRRQQAYERKIDKLCFNKFSFLLSIATEQCIDVSITRNEHANTMPSIQSLFASKRHPINGVSVTKHIRPLAREQLYILRFASQLTTTTVYSRGAHDAVRYATPPNGRRWIPTTAGYATKQ